MRALSAAVRWRTVTLVVCSTILATWCNGSAGPPPKTHEGQFFHVASGFGWMSTSATDNGDDLDLHGLTFDGDLAIGSMLRQNFALHATFYGWFARDPNVKFLDESKRSNTDVVHGAAALGATYYFMPANIFASARLGGGWMWQQRVFGGQQNAAKSNFGFVGGVAVGKEWWTSDYWAIGISGDFDFHVLPSADFDGTFKGGSFAIHFTATHN